MSHNQGDVDMKKGVSYILLIISILSHLTFLSPNTFAISLIDSEQFSSKLYELINTYKKTSTVNFNNSKASIAEGAQKDNKNYSSMRLLVECNQNINTLNAVSVVSGYRNIWVLQFATIEDTINAYNYYNHLHYVNSVEPDIAISVSNYDKSINNTEEFPFLSWGAEFAGFDSLFTAIENYSLETVSVAVIDTGVDSTHPILSNRIEDTGFNVATINNYNTRKEINTYDDNGHGTHVAGIIANVSLENVVIRPYKVLDYYGTGSISQVIAGIYRAIEDGVDIINLSLGGEYSKLEEKAIEEAEKANIVVVASAGNDASDEINYPAGFNTTLSVSSIDENGMISGFSSYGDTISIAAPGSEINSSFPEDSYKTLSGTSMAAPFVSAACAMAKALHNDASSKEIRALLLSSTKPPTQEENADLYYGYGLLNAFGILNEIPNNYNDYGFTDTPAIFMETDVYRDIAEVTITFPQESTVYYTLDGSQPNQNSFLYSDPIILTNTTTISAVAYSSEKRKSKTIIRTIYITQPISDDEIEISPEGMIISCITDKTAVYIPDHVNGITPISVGKNAFSNQNMKAEVVYLPDSVKMIEDYSFYSSRYLKKLNACGVVDVGKNAFAKCKRLESISLPAAKYLASYCFSETNSPERAKQRIQLNIPNVNHIDSFAFYKSTVQYLHLPLLTEIEDSAFAESIYLQYVSCDKLTVLSDYAFENCVSLSEVFIPKLQAVAPAAFQGCSNIFLANFPVCKVVDSGAFCMCENLQYIQLPEMTTCEVSAFENCDNLAIYEFPKLEEIFFNELFGDSSSIYISPSANYIVLPELKRFNSNAQIEITNNMRNIILSSIESFTITIFAKNNYTVEYMDLSSCKEITNSSAFATSIYGNDISFELIYAPLLESASSLPYHSSIVVSSTLQNISCILEKMTFYGIPNTYAQQYANKYGHTFISVPYIVPTTVPNEIDGKKVIEIDAIGFNLCYQWFASYDGTTENTVLLEGERDNILDTKSVIKAPFYYCVVFCENNGATYSTSTKAIKNTAYSVADYSELDKALEMIPKDLSIYTEDSVFGLNTIIENINRNLDVSEQAIVDEYVELLKSAIDNLTTKSFLITFSVDKEYRYSDYLSYGEKIVKPQNPYKPGYIFCGWTPEIPDTMPAYDLTFYAIFVEEDPFAVNKPLIINNFVYKRTIDYLTTITFSVKAENVPKNAAIVWFINGEETKYGDKITIENAIESFTVQAKIIDRYGRVLCVSETELVIVKTDIISIIISFFRMLFHILPVIEQ